MADKINNLEKRVDALAASIDQRFDVVDQRFKDVDAAFVEQRQYTEFAFSKLEAKMDAGFSRMDDRFSRMDGRFSQMDSRFSRLERKLDQFIDTQSQTNQLVERRLTALEPRGSG